MKTIWVTMILLISNCGCAFTPNKPTDKPSMSWVLTVKQGCTEKVSLRGKGLTYHNCF